MTEDSKKKKHRFLYPFLFHPIGIHVGVVK